MILVGFLMLTATLAWGSGGGESAPRGAGGSNGPQLREVTLMLDWVANANHVGMFAARDRGFFEAHGLDVRIVEPGEVYAASAVVGGQAEFGIDFQESVTMLRAQDIPVVSIAAVLQTNTSGFAVRAGKSVLGPADFEGLIYGTFNSPYEKPTLDALVRCAGGDPESISYVTAGTDLLAMLQQEQADLVWIFYGTQGFQARRLGLEIDYFPLNEYQECIPDYYTPVVITSRQVTENDPALAESFLAALTEAHEWVVENPVAAAEILAQAVPELSAEELRESVPWLARHMIMDAPQWGHQELVIWQEYGAWMRSAGVLEGSFDAATAYTNEFLPRP
jgi:ABC-type nitrate/sulfonate/bicarbonate transport system substrate-binding protein